MNCPAEHMVGTIKRRVEKMLRSAHCNLKILKLGRTYQKWIEDAVQELGNGAAGRWHIMRSVEKLPCIHKILAADEGQELTVDYIFGRWAPHEHQEECDADPEHNRDFGAVRAPRIR